MILYLLRDISVFNIFSYIRVNHLQNNLLQKWIKQIKLGQVDIKLFDKIISGILTENVWNIMIYLLLSVYLSYNIKSLHKANKHIIPTDDWSKVRKYFKN